MRRVAPAVAAVAGTVWGLWSVGAAPWPSAGASVAGATGGASSTARVVAHRPLSISGPSPIAGDRPDRVEWSGAPARLAQRATPSESTNWSGEIDVGTNFTSVSGNWTVPAVAASTTPQFVSTWIGVGGANTRTGLIQTGTDEFTTAGDTTYAAWVEVYPAPQVAVTPVAPGDHMEASITKTGPATWDVQIEDVTARWTASGSITYNVGAADSVEWITERPEVTTTLATLANYRSSTFTGLEVSEGDAPGAPPASSSLAAVDMVVGTGQVISYPGPVATQTGAAPTVRFTDHFVAPSTRIYGPTADATAAAELEHQFTAAAGSCPGTGYSRPVVLATDANYPDALASAYLARSLGTGTLLTPPDELSNVTATAIRREGITQVYVVGGPLAVSTAVVQQLEATDAYDCGGGSPLANTTIDVTRIYGQTEYETAQDIAEAVNASDVGSLDLAGAYAGTNASGGVGAYNTTAGLGSPAASSPTPLPTAIVATGQGFQDAEAASTLSYAEELPILLTTPSTLSQQASAAIAALGVKQVIVMGGQLAVSNAVVTALQGLGVSVLRVAGDDYTGTAVELAGLETATVTGHLGLGWKGTGAVTVARGDYFTDGLAGAVVAADGPEGAAPEPLLLTLSPTTVGTSLAAYLATAGKTGIGGRVVMRLTILGGPLAVTATTAKTMGADLG